MVYFAEQADVQSALQQVGLNDALGQPGDGPLSPEFVDDAIEAASDWFARKTNGHWYDSGGAASDNVDTTARTATGVSLDVPSSPHRQRGQLISDYQDIRYPVTTAGPYARIPLPHQYVQTVTALNVRDLGGGTTDWVASSDFTEGRGEDYYVTTPGQQSHGRSFLYIRADSIGVREDFSYLLGVDYDYGLDRQDTTWADVRRGIAHRAAAELVDDDDVLSQVPDNGQIVNLNTQVENLRQRADEELDPYLSAPVA